MMPAHRHTFRIILLFVVWIACVWLFVVGALGLLHVARDGAISFIHDAAKAAKGDQ